LPATTTRLFATSLLVVLSGCTHRYAVEGVLVKTSPARDQLTISHDPIPGYMDAMVMPFHVREPAALPDAAAGDRLKFRLVVSKSVSYIDRISVLSAARPDAGLARSPAQPVLVPIGAPMPDVSLVDTHGNRVTLADLRGQVVLVTFIYTRCPLPDYCPLQMANFAQVKDRLGERLGRDVTLLTITFDPKYDTTDVMARYGANYGADGRGWRLLTGTPQEIQRVTEAFGIEFYPEEGLITHSLQTAVIDREGRLFAAIEGREHSVQQIMDVTREALAR
jgi:protein SCO1